MEALCSINTTGRVTLFVEVSPEDQILQYMWKIYFKKSICWSCMKVLCTLDQDAKISECKLWELSARMILLDGRCYRQFRDCSYNKLLDSKSDKRVGNFKGTIKCSLVIELKEFISIITSQIVGLYNKLSVYLKKSVYHNVLEIVSSDAKGESSNFLLLRCFKDREKYE
uniref:DUF4371 domain-containing protein n=1 Tax=Strongyloides venezuelensis TaxID=75913 RepID=A0A0K0G5X4_STRVS